MYVLGMYEVCMNVYMYPFRYVERMWSQAVCVDSGKVRSVTSSRATSIVGECGQSRFRSRPSAAPGTGVGGKVPAKKGEHVTPRR